MHFSQADEALSDRVFLELAKVALFVRLKSARERRTRRRRRRRRKLRQPPLLFEHRIIE